ncbi:MAG: hypothetical protein OIF50_01715 [Flavobacteriaceae bacterium]|nr:hypothetical protein [Flavobacteriaceae bacterium]
MKRSFLNKKVLYLIVFLILLGVIILISNPFYWAMASSVAEQPKLSNKEDVLFKKWKDSCSCNIERFFDYEDGEKAFFNYSLSFESTNRSVLESKESYKIARIVLDSILEPKKEYLREMRIHKTFSKETEQMTTRTTVTNIYRYDLDKDSLLRLYRE